MINKKPHEEGWMFKLKLSDSAEVEEMLDSEAYEASLEA